MKRRQFLKAGTAGTLAYTSRLHRETVGEFEPEAMLDLSAAEQWAEQAPEKLAERLKAAGQSVMVVDLSGQQRIEWVVRAKTDSGVEGVVIANRFMREGSVDGLLKLLRDEVAGLDVDSLLQIAWQEIAERHEYDSDLKPL